MLERALDLDKRNTFYEEICFITEEVQPLTTISIKNIL